jgi:hypothetical protein
MDSRQVGETKIRAETTAARASRGYLPGRKCELFYEIAGEYRFIRCKPF